MMNLYFCSLQQCTELLIDIFSLTAFLKVSFRDGHDKLALMLKSFFIEFSRYFCTLIFPLSLPSLFFHTHCFQLVCDTALFTISPFSPLDPCSPFTPLIPGGPLLPRDPSSSLNPFTPIIPGALFLPSDPGFPFSPLAPVVPLGPLTQGSPWLHLFLFVLAAPWRQEFPAFLVCHSILESKKIREQKWISDFVENNRG